MFPEFGLKILKDYVSKVDLIPITDMTTGQPSADDEDSESDEDDDEREESEDFKREQQSQYEQLMEKLKQDGVSLRVLVFKTTYLIRF